MSPAEPKVSVVTVSYNTREDLLRSLACLETVALPLETIVVDNASSDGSAEAARRRFPAARVIENPENLGFSRANNRGLREARAPYVLLLNSDAEVRPGAVETLAALLDGRSEVGIVGPRTLSTDGTVQVCFGPALTPLGEWRQRRLVRGVRARRPAALARAEQLGRSEHEPVWVSGACMMARRAALEAVGGFDEGFFLYEEDVDLCVRVRAAGWRILYAPRAEIVHHLGRSIESSPSRARIEYHRSHVRYYRKHNGPVLTALLRAHILARALAGWLGALGPGEERGTRRSEQRVLMALAWQGL